MEDEDGESRSTDMWPILGERVHDPALGNSLKHSNDDVAYVDVSGDDSKQPQRHYSPIVRKDSPDRNTVTGPRLTFKGFKKRMLTKARELHSAVLRNSALEQQQLVSSNASTKSGGKERRAEGKHKITEYLGLQPSSRHKCPKCHGWLNCGPNSKQNLCVCNPNMTPMPGTSETASLPHTSSSNFKITRKVYLCAACGTYFENWNLFLHMRDIHKRHICLFCLGMFGQAERLLHHLSKKHNVPDLEFASEDEFYSVFKGSCYLVCCGCERIFSETDNFYDHFCSPTFKQDATAGMSVCTLCRQTGTHASTCNFALPSEADRESYTSTTLVPVATDSTRADDSSPAVVPSSDKILNLGGKGLPRKVMKNNRSKHGPEGMSNSHQPKTNALVRKFGARGRWSKNQLPGEPNVQRELVNNLPRDTVSETIMEVSRYTGDSSDENDENDEQAMNKDFSRDKGSAEKSPAQNHQLDCNEPYDSVTETIMEVSRCTSDIEEEEDVLEKEVLSTCVSDSRSMQATEKTFNEEEINTSDKSDVDLMHQSASPKAPSPVRWDSEETPTPDKKTNTVPYELESESAFRPYDSPQNARSRSPVSRSLFSPRHESHASDPQSKEREDSRDDFSKNEEEEAAVEKEERPMAISAGESQLSVSFNAVPSSDRSLVIKICTNRNSQFSVTSAAAVSRGSEENNNADGSTTSKEKLANGSGEKDVVGHDQANDLDDSDSDSDKLAVVDSNPEEDEEAEDGEEGEEADEIEEIEDKRNNTIIDSQDHSGEIGSGIFDVVETDVPSGDATTKLDSRTEENVTNDQEAKNHTTNNDDGITLAGEDAPCVDLNVEGTLDSMELDELLKRCIEVASPICVYCNHARCIAVNGKQLGLHMLAEHKFQPQHPAIIIHAEQFTARVKRSLDELESRHFNLNTYDSAKGTYNVPEVRMYECFHCRFHSAVHKELYLHNRKMHQKTILICIMCKSTFYSYSELLCHLCPGIYSPNINLRYRCCLCSVNSLPSSFRLMVHLRKQHHACDVCLESTGNQQRLSNHVWKHKLHHLCYRCGIAYRNKPDITKHLFWKHGTESVLCRKCVQKKWPHIYHFCIPPAEFKCDECECKFQRAVALKVHKRLHSTNLPYGCDECAERFISRKLLAKHQARHREPEQDVDVNVTDVDDHPPADGLDEKSDKAQRTGATASEAAGAAAESVKDAKEAVKRVVDVYDLPPLNLSSESDTDNEEEKVVAIAEKSAEKEKVVVEVAKAEKSGETVEEEAADDSAALLNDIVDVERNEEEKKQEERIMDGIWDNFKTYAASLEMKESSQSFALKESPPEDDPAYLSSIVLADHDYCVVWSENGEQATTSKEDDAKEEQDDAKSRKSPSPGGGSPSHNRASCESDATKRAKVKSPKKKKRSGSTSSSDSSSDTDSSSCSCGTNCSCSSSSSGSSSSSSSSSDSDSSTSESSPRKQSSRRGKKEKENSRENKAESVEPENKEEVTIENGIVAVDKEVVTNEPALSLMRESDLETDETVTDEDFYDEHPQPLVNTLLAEKRNQLLLLATVSTSVEQQPTQLNNGVSEVPPAAEITTLAKPVTTSVEDRPQQKKKTKTKKRRKGERGDKRNATAAASTVESIKLNIPKAYYQKNPGFAASSPAMLSTLNPSRSSTPNLPVCNDIHGVAGGMSSSNTMEMLQTPTVAGGVTIPTNPNQNVGGSGSETENKRFSKRKRVPKRFYGDSSDDEPQEKQQQLTHKWGRKTVVETVVPAFAPPTPVPLPMTTSTPMTNSKSMPPSRLSFGGKITQQTYRPGQTESHQHLPQQQVLPVTLASATESEEAAETSSESSESEIDVEVDDSVSQRTYNDLPPTNKTTPAAERPVKYCYCRCPYDEVSEMIACDGENCRIEWYHFECVGIMVPPEGKWYCPDCRRNMPENNDENCD